MADDPTLTLRSDVTPESTVVHCSGRLILSTADALKSYVKPRIVRGGSVVLDLTDLTFMDSMGLGTIATLWISSKTAGCQLALINLSPRIRDLFTVTHLLSLFEACGESNARIT
jgi:anti-sigma B factor antagonist